MFSWCYSLKNVNLNALPATSLSSSCYKEMFNGCRNLKNAPNLLSTMLEYACYSYMFAECNSLEKPAKMPNTVQITPNYHFDTTTNNSFREMYYNCTSLRYMPKLPVFNFDNWPSYYLEGIYGPHYYPCENMLKGCTQIILNLYNYESTPYQFSIPYTTQTTVLIDTQQLGIETAQNPQRPQLNTIYYCNLETLND